MVSDYSVSNIKIRANKKQCIVLFVKTLCELYQRLEYSFASPLKVTQIYSHLERSSLNLKVIASIICVSVPNRQYQLLSFPLERIIILLIAVYLLSPVKQNVPTVFEKFISYLTKESRRNGGVLRKPNKKRDEMGEEEDRESIHLKKLSEVIFIVFSKGNSFCLENKQLFFKDIWPGAIPFFSSTGSVQRQGEKCTLNGSE